MDFTPIIAQVWGTFSWFIPLMLLVGLFKSPWAKGQIGELLVRLFAHWQLDKQTYRRLHNVTQGIGFIRYIKSFQQAVFSGAEVDAMLHALQTGRRAPSLATQREHVQNLKRRSDPTAERQCPKCSNALLIRTVKSSPKAEEQFWGGRRSPNTGPCDVFEC